MFGVQGPIEAIVPTYYIDFTLAKDRIYEHAIPPEWNSIIIVHNGTLEV